MTFSEVDAGPKNKHKVLPAYSRAEELDADSLAPFAMMFRKWFGRTKKFELCHSHA
jgi:hypothetical protein